MDRSLDEIIGDRPVRDCNARPRHSLTIRLTSYRRREAGAADPTDELLHRRAHHAETEKNTRAMA